MQENIVKLEYGDKELYLLKTAHVSRSSKEEVAQAFAKIQPDSICIELDEQRYERLNDPEAWRNTDIVEVIKTGQTGYLMVNLILSSFQRRMADSLGTSSGGEMLEGIRLSKENDLPLILADRSIKTTFARIWHLLGTSEKVKLLSTIVASLFDDEQISEEDLEQLKQADALDAALMDVAKSFPTVKKVLVDERDMYLCEKIRTAPGKKVLAIIGAAHSLGIEKYLNEPIDTAELDKVEKKKSLGSYIRYLIPAAIILMIIATFINNRDVGLSQIRSWWLWHGGLSAFGVLLALGHPLSILTAFIMAPFTALNPLLASGWFAGLVEAYIRKPKVKDFEDLAADTATAAGFWKNRVTRTLMVVIFANLFSSLATFISSIDILSKFFENL